MRINYLTIILSFVCAISIHAQTLDVKNFSIKANDITARTQPRQDINGNDCALVKVQLASSGAIFDGNVIGDVPYNTSEYLVYMSQGSKRLIVKLEGYLPLEVNFADYDIKSLEPKTVYLLTVTGVVTGKQEPVRIKTGWVILDSEPSGASVYINEEFVGNTPLSNYKQAYGTYQYRLESPNYYPTTGTIELNAGRYEQKIVLKPAFGSVSVTSNVSGADVLLDDKKTGKTTPAILNEVSSGKHTVTIQKDKYAPKRQELVVEDGQTTKLNMVLDARFAHIKIMSITGAKIYCNGKQIGTSNCFEDLIEGYYDIEARLDHHKTATKQIEVIAGKNQEIELNPIPKYGSLDIVSNPHDANVFIDGTNKGKSPLTIDDILEGEHEIKLSLDGYAIETRKVNIEENKTSSVNVSLQKKQTNSHTINNKNESQTKSWTNIKAMSDSYLQKQDFENSLKYYKEYLDNKPELNSEDLEGLAKIYSKYADADESRKAELIGKAIESYKAMGEKFPIEKSYAAYQCASMRNKLDRTGEKGLAKPDYQKVVELLANKTDRNNSENTMLKYSYHYLMAYSFLYAKDKVLAKEYADKILAIDPEYAPAQQIRDLK